MTPKESYTRLHDPLGSTYRSQNAYRIVKYLSDRWRLRGRLLSQGPVRLHVKVTAKFFESSQRVLVVEIPGTATPGERVLQVADIDNAKPGANNAAFGVGGEAELARTIARPIRDGRLESPSRTLTLLFGAEREGSRLWVDQLGEGPQSILAVLNSDMTGEDTRQTGGTFLMERTPDPAMQSPRLDRFAPEIVPFVV